MQLAKIVTLYRRVTKYNITKIKQPPDWAADFLNIQVLNRLGMRLNKALARHNFRSH